MGDKNETTKNIFSEDGRLLHAEYANKNVGEAGTIAGLVCTDGVIILGINPSKSETIEKLFKVNDEVHVVVSGIFSDALRLIKFARLESYNILEETGRLPRLSVLCDCVAMEKQKYTQRASSRPFGVSIIYCGYEDGEYVIYSTEPSGTVNRWKACSFGVDSDCINTGLRNIVDEEKVNLDDGIAKLLTVIEEAREWSEEIADRMEILLYTKKEARIMKSNEIREIVKLVDENKKMKNMNK